MLKLLLCLVTGMLIAVCLLQLRQQRLELSHEANRLHNQIEARQAKLWNQQLQIAVYTAPNAIQKTVGDHDLKLAPQSPTDTAAPNWLDGKAPAPAPAPAAAAE
jgi:cell division protein FtsL